MAQKNNYIENACSRVLESVVGCGSGESLHPDYVLESWLRRIIT